MEKSEAAAIIMAEIQKVDQVDSNKLERLFRFYAEEMLDAVEHDGRRDPFGAVYMIAYVAGIVRVQQAYKTGIYSEPEDFNRIQNLEEALATLFAWVLNGKEEKKNAED